MRTRMDCSSFLADFYNGMGFLRPESNVKLLNQKSCSNCLITSLRSAYAKKCLVTLGNHLDTTTLRKMLDASRTFKSNWHNDLDENLVEMDDTIEYDATLG